MSMYATSQLVREVDLDGLRAQVGVEAVAAELGANAGHLVAAERHVDRLVVRGVDPDCAGVDLGRGLVGLRDVARENGAA